MSVFDRFLNSIKINEDDDLDDDEYFDDDDTGLDDSRPSRRFIERDDEEDLEEEEEPIRPGEADGAAGRTEQTAEPGGDTPGSRRSIPGSTAFVPSSAGLLIASHVVRELALKK